MSADLENDYDLIRSGRAGFYEQPRGLIAVWGKEAVPFLDGMITNDMKTLEDGAQMLAAFPNAQGRLLAVVRVQRQGDRFLFEAENATRERLFQSLYRFTFAGDFFVADISQNYRFVHTFNFDSPCPVSVMKFTEPEGLMWVIPGEERVSFSRTITDREFVEISDDLYETLRIEAGIPKYGVDMDETTIVPELGLDGMISYSKGCYIGQEIIARIHFRGHVAKQLTGIVLSEPPAVAGGLTLGAELISLEGKPAGRIASVTHSPKLEKTIALAFVRYDYLAEGTELSVEGKPAIVTQLPFVS